MSFETLCNLDVPIYPNLVKEFYGTLARSFGGFTSTVKGITMNITHLLLGRILYLAMRVLKPLSMLREKSL